MVVDEGQHRQREAGGDLSVRPDGGQYHDTGPARSAWARPFQLQENPLCGHPAGSRRGGRPTWWRLSSGCWGLMAQLRENTGMLLSLFVGGHRAQARPGARLLRPRHGDDQRPLAPRRRRPSGSYTDLEQDQTPRWWWTTSSSARPRGASPVHRRGQHRRHRPPPSTSCSTTWSSPAWAPATSRTCASFCSLGGDEGAL